MYRFIKSIIKIALFFFFRRIIVSGKENIPDNGPLIIVANHPNTLMDPLLIAAITKQRIGFIGNASLFINNYVSAFFKFFHVIPIYRKKDVKPGEKPNNENTFIKCHEYLEKGNTFIIFPEGNSYYELKLRPIKTGTARIALSYEALKKFKGDLKILPIAIDYSNSIQFRSTVSLIINQPIAVQDFKQVYSQDQFKGVKMLTEAIRKVLAKDIPQTTGKDQEKFLIKAHKFYTAYGPLDDNLQHPNHSLFVRTKVSRGLNYLQKQHTTLYQDTQTNMFSFFRILKEEGLTTGFFTPNFLRKSKLWILLSYFIKFVLLSPVYAVGLISNYIPYILPSKIFKAMGIDIEYRTSVLMISGIFTFPIFYALEIWLVGRYFTNVSWITNSLWLVFPVCGYITMFYYVEMKRFLRVLHFYFVLKSSKKTEIINLKNSILKRFEGQLKDPEFNELQ